MDELFLKAGELGVTALFALYLLIRGTSVINDLARSVNNLANTVGNLTDKVNAMDGHVSSIDSKLGMIERRIDKQEQHFELLRGIESRLEKLDDLITRGRS